MEETVGKIEKILVQSGTGGKGTRKKGGPNTGKDKINVECFSRVHRDGSAITHNEV
jgi:hypothetical protein